MFFRLFKVISIFNKKINFKVSTPERGRCELQRTKPHDLMEFNSIFSNETQLIDDIFYPNSQTGGNLRRSSRLKGIHVNYKNNKKKISTWNEN